MAAKSPLTIVAGRVQQLQAGDNIDVNRINLGAAYEVTIVAETIDVTNATGSVILVDSDGGNTLNTINGSVLGDYIVIKRKPGTATFTVGTGGNIDPGSPRELADDRESIALIYNGTLWLLIGLVT